jgi:hypothetical protein
MTAVRATDSAGERRCIVARTVEARTGLVRFVAHGTVVVPDLAERLPGRGAWVGAERVRIDEAVRRNLFSRAFQRRVDASPDLAGQVEELVAKRVVELVGLARRAGRAVHGRDRCLETLREGVAGLLIVADDAGSETRRMQRAAAASGVTTGTGPCKAALGTPFGADSAAYVAIWAGSLCDRIARDLQRLAGLRPAVHGDQA